MKKIYLSALALVFGASVSAQVVNGGFENWTSGEPDSWVTQDPFIPQLITAGANVEINGSAITESVTESTTAPIEGGSNAQIQSFTLSNSPIPNQVPDGVYGNYVSQKVPTTTKYGGVAFAYKSNIQGTDAVGVFVNATKNGNVVAQGFDFYVSSEANWVRDTINLSFSADPDTIEILFASSFGTILNGTQAPATGVDGTTMEVDDVQFLPELVFANPVTNVVASDISDNGDGSDLEITFEVPDETNIESYYVAVFAAPYSGDNLAQPEAFMLGNGIEITPNGSDQTHTFSASDVYWDVVGNQFEDNPIVENVDFIVSVYSKGTTGYEGVIANSNVIKLTSGGVSVTKQELNLNIYPNPATNFVNFEIDGLENGNVVINSITGQEVVNTTINGNKQVDVSSLNNGVYIYTIRNQNGEVVKTNKLVIRK